MHAILTQDHADFDALAALLGAKKIYPAALAILPHQLNRNVRDFIALYAIGIRPLSRAFFRRLHPKKDSNISGKMDRMSKRIIAWLQPLQ